MVLLGGARSSNRLGFVRVNGDSVASPNAAAQTARAFSKTTSSRTSLSLQKVPSFKTASLIPKAAIRDLYLDPTKRPYAVMNPVAATTALPAQWLGPFAFSQRPKVPPFINQEFPDGAGRLYRGEANCGPTCVAMIIRGLALPFAGTDAKLIAFLARLGGTNQHVGTRPGGMRVMLEMLGLPSELRRGGGAAWALNQLQKGRMVIARGDYYAVEPHADASQTEAHYMLLHGLDASGNIKVHDPNDAEVKVLRPEQLDAFLKGDPAEQGVQISVRARRP
jgi:hypothetical protein